MKKMLLFLLPTLLVLTATALASEHTDALGNVWESDGVECSDSAPAPLAEQSGETGLIPLGDPSNLRWDPTDPGTTLWETEGTFQRRLKVVYYRVDHPDEPVVSSTNTYGGTHTDTAFSNNKFLYESGEGFQSKGPLTTGDYYFTVQNLGDGATYGDSAVVSSLDTPDGAGVYHYVEPSVDTTLETPAAGHWEWPASVWDDRQKTDERIKTYYIRYGYSEEKLTDLSGLDSIGGSYASQSGREDVWLQDRLIGEHGAGWYYFCIRPISANIETWRNGN